MPTKAELEAQLATVKAQRTLLLRVVGNTSLFDETPVEELLPLLRAAHDAGAKAAGRGHRQGHLLHERTVPGRWWMHGRWRCGTCPTASVANRAIFDIVAQVGTSWSRLAIPTGELGFPTMYRVLQKLPQDRHDEASAAQATELTVDNLNILPAHGPWQRLEDIEWRIGVGECGRTNGFLSMTEVRCHGSCEGVMAHRSVGASSAGAPASWASSPAGRPYLLVQQACLLGARVRVVSPRRRPVQTGQCLHVRGQRSSFTKVAPRAQLLTILGCRDAASDDALDVLQWAAASLRGMEGCDEASAKECEDVLLHAIAREFAERSAALATLPAPLLGRLLGCDEIDTQTEEQTLLALAPWLQTASQMVAQNVLLQLECYAARERASELQAELMQMKSRRAEELVNAVRCHDQDSALSALIAAEAEGNIDATFVGMLNSAAQRLTGNRRGHEASDAERAFYTSVFIVSREAARLMSNLCCGPSLGRMEAWAKDYPHLQPGTTVHAITSNLDHAIAVWRRAGVDMLHPGVHVDVYSCDDGTALQCSANATIHDEQQLGVYGLIDGPYFLALGELSDDQVMHARRRPTDGATPPPRYDPLSFHISLAGARFRAFAHHGEGHLDVVAAEHARSSARRVESTSHHHARDEQPDHL